MNDLDNLSIYPSLDPTGVRGRLRDLPRQCQLAWEQAHWFHLPVGRRPWDKVVIGGMGGSAIAGDLVASLAAQQRAVPILVVRDFQLPFALDERSLVIVCSYSGNTEETLSIFHEALRTQAQVIAITSGGTLAQEARAQEVSLILIDLQGEPRNVVCYSLTLLLGLLQRLGLASVPEAELLSAIQALQRGVLQFSENVPLMENPAKQLALELQGKVAIIYGGGIFSGLARRWKTQLNENGKTWAFFESIPELLHNSIEAYVTSPGRGEGMVALLLQPVTGPRSLMVRYQVVSELLSRWGIAHTILRSVEGPPLAQLLGMLALGDYVSYYLAILNNIDPSPTPAISSAKERLSDLSEVPV